MLQWYYTAKQRSRKVLAQFFGEMNRRFDEFEKKLDTKADKDVVYAQLNVIIARLDEDRAEL